VLALQADVADEASLARALAEVRRSLPPLAGVFHSAGVLDDGAVLGQDWPRFERVFGPKVDGAWILHRLTRADPLELFVLYSSGSAVLGSAGQANHAAANAVLDALAAYRRALHLPALSIGWGPWSEVGAAAAAALDVRFAARGLGRIGPREGLEALGRLLELARSWPGAPAHVAVLPISSAQLARGHGQTPPRLLGGLPAGRERAAGPLAGADGQPPSSLLARRLREAPAATRRPLLTAHVRGRALTVLGLPGNHAVDPGQPLNELGLDSLMAVELRNVLGADLALARPLPATLVFDYPTLDALVDHLAGSILGWQREDARADGERARMVADLEGLSEDEAEALLLEELGATEKGG
jgi:hypothetical protein